MKIGIFGGTFDPIHHGHLIVAEYVREHVALDRIIFIPTDISPHKQAANPASAKDRLAMLREAIRSNPFFECADVEVARGGVSYTVETLRTLKQRSPSEELYLLIGADNIADFLSWREPGEIVRLAQIIVMNRPGFRRAAPDSPLLRNVIPCEVPNIDISATEIRRRRVKGLPISYLVPLSVAKYIARHHLYIPVQQ
ncbi:MAG TPA: nicotinate-nucleotide adenylyltransferase [Bacteroidota bacterium]|nr:nicotinate-nucleotide adenylyltransferase [Bacteroidota bacterium]